ncbi:MgtC/SapB family protein [Pseudogemmobacter sonorensis]|uniref:MgtC/SapB family protein n=1 Tax=Pseudogemmobacter sonorensis TaxID=2989681 RepID=UPI00369FFDAE
MPVTLLAATINMSVALGCGALIGIERQIRQRKAGLRTNALVALGASAYMVFSMLVEGDMSPSRVAAQVVSGIGFLGAGIIFRDGFNVQGLTTAATLWCSAAVGLLAGGGHWQIALVATGMVVFVNFALRPFVQWLKRRLAARMPGVRVWRIGVSVAPAQEAATRSLMLSTLSIGGLHLGAIERRALKRGAEEGDEAEGIELLATVTDDDSGGQKLEQAVQHLAAVPGLARVRWEAVEEG